MPPAQPTSTAVDFPIAPLWKRLAALFYDSLLLFALLMVAVAVAFALKGGRVAGDNIFFRLYLLLVSGLFFCGFWVAAGQTLGMKTWHLRVQRRDGRPLGWWQALGRFLLAVPSVGLAGIGLWWMLLDREGLALHDRWSGSVVVMLPKQ